MTMSRNSGNDQEPAVITDEMRADQQRQIVEASQLFAEKKLNYQGAFLSLTPQANGAVAAEWKRIPNIGQYVHGMLFGAALTRYGAALPVEMPPVTALGVATYSSADALAFCLNAACKDQGVNIPILGLEKFTAPAQASAVQRIRSEIFSLPGRTGINKF